MNNFRNPQTDSTLLLVCTPFQAWIIKHLPENALPKPIDLIYYTRNNSSEDRYAYNQLSVGKRNIRYMYIKKRRPDVVNHILGKLSAPRWARKEKYRNLCLSSIETPTVCALAAQHPDAKLITFDDGIGNILKTSTFHKDPAGFRMKIYRRILKTPSPSEICQRSAIHYTIYPGFKNIVPDARVFSIQPKSISISSRKQKEICYFIGQPFSFILNKAQIKRIANHATALRPDYYVLHPREETPILSHIPYLEKNGEIAEDAILRHAQDRPIKLVGFFSSTLFNLNIEANHISCLIPKDYEGSSEMITLANKMDFNIINV